MNNNMFNSVKMFKNKKIRVFTMVFAFIIFGGSLLPFYSKLRPTSLLPLIKNYDGMCINCSQVKPRLSPNLNHPKWIVVTSISHPTEQLKKLVAIPQWKVVVVGDKKTPHNWSYPGSVYLSVEDQLNMGYQITKHLPYNSYTRKMIGYLYAIQNGAQFIYDTDDDNCPTKGEIEFNLEPISSGLIYADLNRTVVNPYSHFGQPQLWPRGYPLEAIAQPANHTYHLCTFNTPAVQQGLVNGDPDVDAIYRLINKGSNDKVTINVTFDARAPPFTFPQGVFAPFNSQNTLFSYQALFALFLPSTVDFRVTDIWRGYWAQKLLWLTGNHLAFHPPNAIQVRNPHSYLKDFKEEIQMYEEAGELLEFLSEWQCEPSLLFFQCVERLAADMVKEEFIGKEDLSIVLLWLADLRSVGYTEPVRINRTLETMCFPSEIGTSTWVHYSPTPAPPNSGFYDLYNLCEKHLTSLQYPIKKKINENLQSKYQQSSFQFENILLVILFNYPHLQNIRMMEAVYADHFPNILFCAESSGYEALMRLINAGPLRWRGNAVSFLNVTGFDRGFYGYECAIRAIEMNYKVDGYMILSDDVLLRPWKLLPFDASRSRIQNDTFGAHCFQNVSDVNPNQKIWNIWWTNKWSGILGYNVTNEVFKEIKSIAANASDPRSSLFQTFIKNRFSNGVNMSLSSYSMSDFYYISKQDSYIFAQVLKIFHKHKVYLDMAVPTTLHGCRYKQTLVDHGFSGNSLWHGDRETPLKFLTKDSVYVHPLKVGTLKDKPELLKSYCLQFVDDYFKNW